MDAPTNTLGETVALSTRSAGTVFSRVGPTVRSSRSARRSFPAGLGTGGQHAQTPGSALGCWDREVVSTVRGVECHWRLLLVTGDTMKSST
ncbi:hypothetical protein M514_00622 [Trichuris suis]|uniref:Uncharacterized protein n=1 Tax=Trichuris suis TaxID=68888 RepID=A0A085N741_9BILA|nr:hypothetical protein M513_00622 [Trichuris suis]KFD65287.1 hypothetical protein M514_00622 [Trichuris suis]